MEIQTLYRDKDVVVCIKPVGVLSENGGMPELLSKNGETVYCVHRLDRGVGGVMVYALNKNAASSLSAQITQRKLKKEYLAVLAKAPEESSGTMTDMLFHDKAKNKTYVVKRLRNGVKLAELDYCIEKQSEQYCLVHIILKTGRSHQIRVQFASRGMPLVGDAKYGSNVKAENIGLFACAIEFEHPATKKKLRFEAELPEWFPLNKST